MVKNSSKRNKIRQNKTMKNLNLNRKIRHQSNKDINAIIDINAIRHNVEFLRK